MEFNEFYKLCLQIFEANTYLPPIDDVKAKKLFDLTTRMLEVNKSMNLTAIKEERAIILKHYADSLAVSPHISQNAEIIDVGCGAGFPTLPLAIFRPDLKITAADSTAKRIAYVSETARMLGLDNVTAVAERAEALGNSRDYRERFDYATARAVAALPTLTELCLPLVKVGGRFIAMKAQKADDELSAAISAIEKCGGKLQQSQAFELRDASTTCEARTIITIDKVKLTPKEFPRHYSKISKKPL